MENLMYLGTKEIPRDINDVSNKPSLIDFLQLKGKKYLYVDESYLEDSGGNNHLDKDIESLLEQVLSGQVTIVSDLNEGAVTSHDDSFVLEYKSSLGGTTYVNGKVVELLKLIDVDLHAYYNYGAKNLRLVTYLKGSAVNEDGLIMDNSKTSRYLELMMDGSNIVSVISDAYPLAYTIGDAGKSRVRHYSDYTKHGFEYIMALIAIHNNHVDKLTAYQFLDISSTAVFEKSVKSLVGISTDFRRRD